MKIQIDTTNKTIKIEEKVNLNELFEALNRLFPNNVWKEFSLETNTTINWSPNPIIIQPYHQPYIPSYPSYPNYPWFTYVEYHNIDTKCGINSVDGQTTIGLINFDPNNPTSTTNNINLANVGSNYTYQIPNPITDFNITPFGNGDWTVTLLKDVPQYSLNDGIFDVEIK